MAMPSLLSSLAGLGAFLAIFPPAPTSRLFDEIYARSRGREKALQTVRARFVETTVSTLLLEPLVARGTVIAKRPLHVRIE